MKRAAASLVLLFSVLPAGAQDVEEGLRLAVSNCSQCHAIGDSDSSPLKDAPPFRTVHEFYLDGELEQVLKEGIVAAHPAMPQWKMTPQQARALAAYIMSFGPAKPE